MTDDDVTERIETQSYPVETSDLAASVGEVDDSAGRAIERAGNGTIATAEDAQLTLQCGMGGDAVGRRKYSDRDPGSIGEESHRRLSF